MARRVGFQIEGLQQAERRIDGVADRAKNPLPHSVAAVIERELKLNERRRFQTGRGWRRLTPKWVEYKRTHGYDVRKLVMTGGLEHTLTQGGADLVYRTTHYAITFGLKPTRRYIVTAKTRKPVMADRASRTAIAQIVQHFIAHAGQR